MRSYRFAPSEPVLSRLGVNAVTPAVSGVVSQAGPPDGHQDENDPDRDSQSDPGVSQRLKQEHGFALP
jgi:hypothetical protein